jgi:hypothetical protein
MDEFLVLPPSSIIGATSSPWECETESSMRDDAKLYNLTFRSSEPPPLKEPITSEKLTAQDLLVNST